MVHVAQLPKKQSLPAPVILSMGLAPPIPIPLGLAKTTEQQWHHLSQVNITS
jgi:hypothetical protein